MVAMRKGFTVIEVLVVVSIMALLAALLAPVLAEVKTRALMTKSTSNMRQIGAALALYRQAHGDDGQPLFSLPPSLATLRESQGLSISLFRTGGSDYLYPGQPAVYTWLVPRSVDRAEDEFKRWEEHVTKTAQNPVVLLDETFPGNRGAYRFDARRATGLYLDTHIDIRWATGSLSQYQVWE